MHLNVYTRLQYAHLLITKFVHIFFIFHSYNTCTTCMVFPLNRFASHCKTYVVIFICNLFLYHFQRTIYEVIIVVRSNVNAYLQCQRNTSLCVQSLHTFQSVCASQSAIRPIKMHVAFQLLVRARSVPMQPFKYVTHISLDIEIFGTCNAM